MKQETSEEKRVRHAVDLIGVTILMEYLINIVLLVIFRFVPDIQNEIYLQVLDIAFYVLIYFVPFYVLSRWRGWTLRSLCGTERPKISAFVMAFCLAVGWNFIATILSVGMEFFVELFGYTEPVSSYALPGSTVGMLLQILQIALIPPVVEELCFRGFYLKTAQKAMGIWPAILFSSLLFWLAHDSISIFPLAFGFGILGGALRVKYRSLLPSMCAHFIINSTYILMNWMQATQPIAVQNSLSSLFVLVELVCLIAGIWLAHRLGLFAAVRDMMFRSRRAANRVLLRGIFTSVPFWIVLLAAAFFTLRGLEALG